MYSIEHYFYIFFYFFYFWHFGSCLSLLCMLPCVVSSCTYVFGLPVLSPTRLPVCLPVNHTTSLANNASSPIHVMSMWLAWAGSAKTAPEEGESSRGEKRASKEDRGGKIRLIDCLEVFGLLAWCSFSSAVPKQCICLTPWALLAF